jgi:hypothetical protein
MQLKIINTRNVKNLSFELFILNQGVSIYMHYEHTKVSLEWRNFKPNFLIKPKLSNENVQLGGTSQFPSPGKYGYFYEGT